MKRLLSIAAIFCFISLSAQTLNTDSLLKVIRNLREDAKALDLILAACGQNDINLDTFIHYSFIAQKLARHSGDTQKIVYAAYWVAYAHYYNSDNDSARMEIEKALRLLTKKTEAERTLYYKLQGLKATTYQGERNHTAALKILYPLLQEAEENKDSLFVAQSMHQIAIIEGQQSHPAQLIDWENKAISSLPASRPESKEVLATIYATLGRAYMQQNMPDSASHYHQKAIVIFRQANDLYNLAIVLQRQAHVFINRKDTQGVRKILEELSFLNKKIQMGSGDLNYYLTFINYYLLSGDYEKAIALCREHLYGDKAISNWKIRLSYLQALAAAYKATRKTELYAATLQELVAAQDSFYQANSAEAIAEMQTKYEVQKKENTIISQQLTLFRQNMMFYGSLLLVAAGAVIIWLLFRNYQRKNEMKMLLLREDEKRKSELAVKEAEEKERKRIAADLHDSLGSYAASIKANTDDLMLVQHISQKRLELLRTNAQQMVALLGDTIWALRKEALLLCDISDRIKILIQRMRSNYPNVQLTVEEDILQDIALSPSVAFDLFMMVQEALSNALRHSGANTISVMIHSDHSWRVQVIDNGKGIDNTIPSLEGGNGMYNMQMRATNIGCYIEWKKIPHGGTEVLITANTF